MNDINYTISTNHSYTPLADTYQLHVYSTTCVASICVMGNKLLKHFIVDDSSLLLWAGNCAILGNNPHISTLQV